MTGFVDLHHHFLYGLDDGARDFDAMVRMLQAAWNDGVTTLVATPHVTPGLKQAAPQLLIDRFYEAQNYCNEAGIPLRLFLGAELLYTPMIHSLIQTRQIITLGNTELVLLEFTPQIAFDEVTQVSEELLDNGFVPVLAHVERYACIRKNPGRALRFKESCPAKFQMNASTVLRHQNGLQGRPNRQMLEEGLIDFIASDAHNTSSRPVEIGEAYEVLKGQLGRERASGLCAMNQCEFFGVIEGESADDQT